MTTAVFSQANCFRKGREEGSKVILRIGRASKHAHKHAVQTVRYGTCILLCGSVTCICPVPVPTFPLVLFFMPFLFPFSWYTDNGLFLTSGRDGKLKVWDPNAQLPIEEFTGTVRNVNKPLVPPGSNGNIYERKKIRF
jgi:hypothetical protein